MPSFSPSTQQPPVFSPAATANVYIYSSLWQHPRVVVENSSSVWSSLLTPTVELGNSFTSSNFTTLTAAALHNFTPAAGSNPFWDPGFVSNPIIGNAETTQFPCSSNQPQKRSWQISFGNCSAEEEAGTSSVRTGTLWDVVNLDSASHKKKKVDHWTEDEHGLFLIGMEIKGKGNWKAIAEEFVVTRNAEQVASHGQKYLRRRSIPKQDRKRSGIHDITITDIDADTMARLLALQRRLLQLPPAPPPPPPPVNSPPLPPDYQDSEPPPPPEYHSSPRIPSPLHHQSPPSAPSPPLDFYESLSLEPLLSPPPPSPLSSPLLFYASPPSPLWTIDGLPPALA